MQRNKSNEIARDIIRTAKETFNERINNITLFNLTDEPYKMFSIKCTISVSYTHLTLPTKRIV